MFDPTLTYALIALENAALAVVVVLMATFFTVEQRTAAIVQRFGKSVREESPTRRTKFATPLSKPTRPSRRPSLRRRRSTPATATARETSS